MGLNNTQYDAIMRRYSQKQLADRHLLEEHRKTAYEKIPRLTEIDRLVSGASLRHARYLLEGDKPSEASGSVQSGSVQSGSGHSSAASALSGSSHRSAASALSGSGHRSAASDLSDSSGTSAPSGSASLREALEEYSRMRTQLLLDNGFPADYLTMQYTCSDCQDTGYINGRKCHCFRQEAIDLFYTQSGLKEILEEENFQHFSYSYYPEDLLHPATGKSARDMMRATVASCLRYIDEFDRTFSNLFFYGGTGLGKTFLSHCIARELIERAHSVIYYSAFELFDLFARNSFGRTVPGEDMTDYIFDCDLLIIDDLGTELTNSFVSSQLFLILNERIQRKKSTLISTNLPLSTFAETYTERVFSRITSDFQLFQLYGNDIRLQKKINPQP